jgi:hypothetical protein
MGGQGELLVGLVVDVSPAGLADDVCLGRLAADRAHVGVLSLARPGVPKCRTQVIRASPVGSNTAPEVGVDLRAVEAWQKRGGDLISGSNQGLSEGPNPPYTAATSVHELSAESDPLDVSGGSYGGDGQIAALVIAANACGSYQGQVAIPHPPGHRGLRVTGPALLGNSANSSYGTSDRPSSAQCP